MSPTTEKARACLTAGPRKSSPLTPHPAEAPVFGTGTNREKYNGSLKTASKVSCTTKHVPLYSRSHTTPLEHHGGTRGHSVCRHCPSGKLRRDGRAAAQNVIPAFSGTSKAVAKVIPELAEWEAHWHGLPCPHRQRVRHGSDQPPAESCQTQ